ncbi:BSCL2 lipid droplet biogenesis associated, seipin, like [Pangasianodon hypophthalmus]|uniref:BSCL2 lipid droplet biogenesis associated, seipin, like n=1 Tax=Pangasianodon hypophthalmus TaxID=310915 RepID=UPI000EFFB231|nr:BSCL2 lipid droplet biogenesis associated, seipin, like [Pangasianodon hypophthalmus]
MEDLNTEGPSIHELNTEIGDLLLQFHKVITGLGLRIKQKVVQTASVLCMLQLLIFVAIFLYVSFYYTFMPTASFVTPVHFYYRTVSDSVCSFPVANFSLLNNGKKQVMTPGQPYQITLDLEMPESPTNMELGMFLVKISCYSYDGQTVHASKQATMLHYRSYLLQTLETLTLLPLMLMGVIEQKQHVPVELYSSYVDSSYKPTVGAVIEIHSQQVQIYKAQLYIHAHFSGIRYVLYHFPFTSAVVGVMSNFMFLSMIILIGFVQNSSLWPHLRFGKWNKPRERREDILEDTYQCERNTHSEENCTGTKTHLLDPSEIRSSDIMDSSSDKMEESIFDTEVKEMVKTKLL